MTIFWIQGEISWIVQRVFDYMGGKGDARLFSDLLYDLHLSVEIHKPDKIFWLVLLLFAKGFVFVLYNTSLLLLQHGKVAIEMDNYLDRAAFFWLIGNNMLLHKGILEAIATSIYIQGGIIIISVIQYSYWYRLKAAKATRKHHGLLKVKWFIWDIFVPRAWLNRIITILSFLHSLLWLFWGKYFKIYFYYKIAILRTTQSLINGHW